jgi:hypothetical protein
MDLLTLNQMINDFGKNEVTGFHFSSVNCDCLIYPDGGHSLSYSASIFRNGATPISVNSENYLMLIDLLRVELKNEAAQPMSIEL